MNMKKFVTAWAFGLAWSSASAGVVVEMEVQGGGASGAAAKETIYAQGEMARMDSEAGGEPMSVIFRDQTFWFVNHATKAGQKIDQQSMNELAAQLDAMMQQLAQLPPQQRAMMEKMMKGKMPGLDLGDEVPPRRIEKGGTERVGEYPCTVHTLYSGETKVWDVCSSAPESGAEIEEAMGAFRAMTRFSEELQKIVRQGPFAQAITTPFSEIEKLEGFPVRVRSYDGQGRLVRESVLKSITRQDVDDAIFAVPKGYKIKDLASEMKKGR